MAGLYAGLTAQGVPAAAASGVSHLPPTAIMFAALLGYNPIQMLLGSTLTKLPASHAAYLTGHSFFPSLIAAPFQSGLEHRVRLRDRGLPDRRGDVAAAGQALRAAGSAGESAVAARATADAESILEAAAEAPPRCGSRSRKT